jgi:ubiquinone/menaquinone biosynthesis C-methylase UbiE
MTMVSQKDVFLAGEADQYYRRNAGRLVGGKEDLVIECLRSLPISPRRILEIGCANGYRIAALANTYGASGAGIDPSAMAIADGKERFPNIDLRVGTADSLPFPDGNFDLVIFGFCLYLVDPRLHFQTVAAADRVLGDSAHLVVFDFIENSPYKNEYSYMPGVWSHKMEYARYFTASPIYSHVLRRLQVSTDAKDIERDRRVGVDVLVKNMRNAFPANPWKRA